MQVNLDDFGVFADGVNDDVPALVAAEAAIGSNNGREILFSPKTYTFLTRYTTTLPGITYTGVPGATKIQQVGNVIPIVVETDDVTIRGLTLVGDQTPGNRKNLVSVGSDVGLAKRLLVQNCQFIDCSASCILIGADCEDIRILDNLMLDQYENGVDMVQPGGKNIYIERNRCITSKQNPDNGVSRPYGFTIECQTEGVIDGWIVKDNLIDLSGLPLVDRNNTFGIINQKPSTPIASFTLRRAEITGNTIIGAGIGISMSGDRYNTFDPCFTCLIANNTIDTVRLHGIRVEGGEDAIRPDAVTIVGNQINGFSQAQSNAYSGIVLQGNMQSPIVTGNIINTRSGAASTTSGLYGIDVQSVDVLDPQIANNGIFGVTQDINT